MEQFDDDKLYAFAYTTLHRTVLDEGFRRVPSLGQTSEAADSLNDPQETDWTSSTTTDAQHHVSLASEQRLAAECLERLSPEERAFVVKSAELESAPLAQAELGWPHGSASNACHRGRKLLSQLRDCIEGKLNPTATHSRTLKMIGRNGRNTDTPTPKGASGA